MPGFAGRALLAALTEPAVSLGLPVTVPHAREQGTKASSERISINFVSDNTIGSINANMSNNSLGRYNEMYAPALVY